MTDYNVDLSKFPSFLHRMVKYWYSWQEIALRCRGLLPGQVQRESRLHETPEQIYWGARPPEMTNSRELAFIDDADISYYLTWGMGISILIAKNEAREKHIGCSEDSTMLRNI
nr:hypothetical protein [Mycobacterium lepraemurium]